MRESAQRFVPWITGPAPRAGEAGSGPGGRWDRNRAGEWVIQATTMLMARPACEWGYYSYYPYACAPYGYWGPDWFLGGVFIGAGPWYHGWYGRPWGYGYGHGRLLRRLGTWRLWRLGTRRLRIRRL